MTISFRNQQCITLKIHDLKQNVQESTWSALPCFSPHQSTVLKLECFFNCIANIFINAKYQIRCFDVHININQSSYSCSLVLKCLKQICIEHNIHEKGSSEMHYFPDTSGPHSRKMCKTKKQELSARKQPFHK